MPWLLALALTSVAGGAAWYYGDTPISIPGISIGTGDAWGGGGGGETVIEKSDKLTDASSSSSPVNWVLITGALAATAILLRASRS
jgi:hypothetical protein